MNAKLSFSKEVADSREFDSGRGEAEAREEGRDVHIGSLHELLVEKGSKLPLVNYASSSSWLNSASIKSLLLKVRKSSIPSPTGPTPSTSTTSNLTTSDLQLQSPLAEEDENEPLDQIDVEVETSTVKTPNAEDYEELPRFSPLRYAQCGNLDFT